MREISMSFEPGTRIGPYEIEALLGAGGMGQVYRARDTRLGRAVAVKVLPESVSADRELRDRFNREARSIAFLSHPHICALFDIGTHEENDFLVMEYLEGETLADRLSRGAIPLPESLTFGAQIADALAAAHARGIIHRDLKPANLILSPHGVKVLDFGLAKFIDPDPLSSDIGDSPTELATRRQVILGTAAYMSPEQARGKALDRRTDCWSFGVVLFEMLSGRRLFDGGTAADVISAVLRADLDGVTVPPDTPSAVRELLPRLLERDADRRLDDLRMVARVLRDASVGDTGARSPSTGTTAESDHSIVVLPFSNLSPDPENEYFSDGLTEEVIADLSKVLALRVISRTTAMRLKGTEKDLRTVAVELNVRYALEGSVRKAGDNLRITTQLVDTRTDATLWSEKYSGTLQDVFAIQEQVSRQIVDALRLTLTEKESRQLAEAPARNTFAYDTYLRARRDIWSFREERLERAVQELTHALAVVGDDVLLFRGLALANWQYVNAGISGDQRYVDEAERYARKILEMDPQSPYGPALLGYIAIQRGDIVEWIGQFLRAVEADPNDSDHLVWLALGWTWTGFSDRATPLYEKLLSIDPLFDYLQFGLGCVEYFSGRFERAVERYEQARQLSPDHPGWAMVRAQALASTGRFDDAVELIDAEAMEPDKHPLARLTHIFKHALRGDVKCADELTTSEFVEIVWGDLQYTYLMAQAQAILGRNDEAFKWLERAVERGSINYPFLSERDPLLEKLRPDPRFGKLMQSVRSQWEGLEAAVGAK